MRQVLILNKTKELTRPLVAEYADTFATKLRGLSFRKALHLERGFVLAESSAGKANASVHMLGMNFDLSIAWLDDELKVVDVQSAYRWRSILFPRKPARYVIEFHASRLKDFRVGDQVAFQDLPAA